MDDAPEGSEQEREKVVETLFAKGKGTTVYCGYVDDPRNTVRWRAACHRPPARTDS